MVYAGRKVYGQVQYEVGSPQVPKETLATRKYLRLEAWSHKEKTGPVSVQAAKTVIK